MLFTFLLVTTKIVSASQDPSRLENSLELHAVPETSTGLHFPILASRSLQTFSKRADSGSTRVGDYFDLSYTVMVKVGKVEMPLIISTNSGDLSVLSDDCQGCNSTGVALYPKSAFVPKLDSVIPMTYPFSAGGQAGIETVEVAGISNSEQWFVLIHSTVGAIQGHRSSIGFAGSGVLGLGFPLYSGVWWKNTDYQAPGRVFTFSTFGPPILRMATSQLIKLPMFSLSLQRLSIDLTASNQGVLSIGDFPPGVSNDSLTWTRIRAYRPDLTGQLDPEIADYGLARNYPQFWEVFLEGVFFDGVQLPGTTYLAANETSALIESASAEILGPTEIVQRIRDILNGEWFDCSIPHTLAFKINGKLFPVDPRDFILPLAANSTKICRSVLFENDEIPEGSHGGNAYSWTLGTPFLKGVFASFYYGNLTHPWVDPPRVGLLSKVPSNAEDLLKEAVKKGIFPNTTEELFSGSSDGGPSTSVTSTSTQSPLATAPLTSAATQSSAGLWSSWACRTVPATAIIYAALREIHRST